MIVWEKSDQFDTLEIYPLNDLHIGDPKTDIPLFDKFISFILKEPNRFLLFCGDNMNNATKSSVSNVYNETMNPREQKKWLQRELEVVRDRFLCFVPGNHEARSTKDVDAHLIEDVADHLGLSEYYREDEAFVKISFGKRHNGKPATYTIYCVHGNGGGKRPGSALNNMELSSLAIDNLDVFVMGHVHKKMAYKYRKRVIDPRNNRITYHQVLCVVSGAWQDFAGYAARKMLIPGAKGATPIILHAKEKLAEAIV